MASNMPAFEWAPDGPPDIERKGNAGPRGPRTNWSALLGVAATQPGEWLVSVDAPASVATRFNKVDGYEASARNGDLYLRYNPNGEDAEDEGEDDGSEFDTEPDFDYDELE